MTTTMEIFYGERVFSGIFRVHSMRSLITNNQTPYQRFKIEDAFGSAIAYGWSGRFIMEGDIHDMDICYIEGRSRRHMEKWIVDAHRVTPVPLSQEINLTQLIPQSTCPRPEYLVRLNNVISSLTVAPLIHFINSIASDTKLVQQFITVPASMRHHHSHDAGLLIHSIECAEIVMNLYPVNEVEKELGVVAALLHDIAKTRTMTTDMRKTTMGYVIDHDQLTLEILAPHLRYLENIWQDGATALRYLLTWRNNKHGLPAMPVAEAVLAADRLSSALSARNMAYCNTPKWKQFGNLNVGGPTNRFWKPACTS